MLCAANSSASVRTESREALEGIIDGEIPKCRYPPARTLSLIWESRMLALPCLASKTMRMPNGTAMLPTNRRRRRRFLLLLLLLLEYE